MSHNQTRSTKFVSLDTHPANNALVITYDVLAIATDAATGQEISRASKRHQQLVKISMLDKLGDSDAKQAENLAIDLNGLSAEVVRQCPLLFKEKLRSGQIIEDIKLHLLYLINRRQAQSAAQRKASPLPDRPVSSARFGSALSRRSSVAFAKTRRRSADLFKTTNQDDIYLSILYKEKPIEETAAPKLMQELSQHLEQIWLEHQTNQNLQDQDLKIKDVDSYLDALYGESNERLIALFKLQRLFLDDAKLLELANKRLLVCALVRTLTDLSQSTTNDLIQCELVLYCLISLTRYCDIYEQAFSEQINVAAVDVVGCHLGSLAAYIGRLLQESKKDAKICSNLYFYPTCAHLILLANLIQLDDRLKHHPTNEFYLSLTGLLQLLNSQLSYDLRTLSKMDKLDRSVSLLSQLLAIIRKLSFEREFLDLIRGPKVLINRKNAKNKSNQVKNQSPFLDTLVSLVNRLQMSRPGSGQVQSQPDQQHTIVTDRFIQNDFYELELLTLKMINILLIDRRLRLRLIKRNLLKSVLRNLVSLLASRNDLGSFNKSTILIIPLECLYMLTCESTVLEELWKSKIIIRCLFEYLISSSSALCRDLTRELDTPSFQAGPLSPMTEIKFEPDCADHYLLSLWSNLTVNIKQDSILQNESTLVNLQIDYMNSVAEILNIFSKQHRLPLTSDRFRLMVYLHLKLLSNQSYHFSSFTLTDFQSSLENLIEQLANAAISMIDQTEILSPLIVELLWIIGNLLLKSNINQSTGDDTGMMAPCPESLFKLMQKLFSFRRTDFESETDDDLLLASCIYMAIVAQFKEICGKFDSQRRSYERIIRATNFLLTSKSNDKSIIMAALYALTSLTNHHECRRELATLTDANQLDDLIPKVSSFMLHPSDDIADLACRLVNRLIDQTRSNNADNGSRQKAALEIRFGAYNAKWLNAINASRNELLTPPDEESTGNWLDDDDDVVELLEDAAELGVTTSSAGESRFDLTTGQSASRETTQTNASSDFDDDDDEDDFLDSASYDLQAGKSIGISAPDLNVVDSNSMIKHLISRQEIRSQGSSKSRVIE